MTKITWLTSHFLFGNWRECTCVLQSGFCGNLEFMYFAEYFDWKWFKCSLATEKQQHFGCCPFLIDVLCNMYHSHNNLVTTQIYQGSPWRVLIHGLGNRKDTDGDYPSFQ